MRVTRYGKDKNCQATTINSSHDINSKLLSFFPLLLRTERRTVYGLLELKAPLAEHFISPDLWHLSSVYERPVRETSPVLSHSSIKTIIKQHPDFHTCQVVFPRILSMPLLSCPSSCLTGRSDWALTKTWTKDPRHIEESLSASRRCDSTSGPEKEPLFKLIPPPPKSPFVSKSPSWGEQKKT